MARELGTDIAAAVAAADVPAARGVYALDGAEHEEAFEYAIVLEPFDQRTLVEVHYAVIAVSGTRTGRILYVDGGTRLPVPMNRARRLEATRQEIEAARFAVAQARADRIEVDASFRAFAAKLFEAPTAPITMRKPPYRGRGVSFDLASRIIAVVADPFPSAPRPRILVVDDDASAAGALRRTKDFEVIHVDEGWGAVDAVERADFDLVLCAVRVGDMTAATVRRMLVNARPNVAARFALLATARAVENAPPSSVSHRVVALPITVARVRELLERE